MRHPTAITSLWSKNLTAVKIHVLDSIISPRHYFLILDEFLPCKHCESDKDLVSQVTKCLNFGAIQESNYVMVVVHSLPIELELEFGFYNFREPAWYYIVQWDLDCLKKSLSQYILLDFPEVYSHTCIFIRGRGYQFPLVDIGALQVFNDFGDFLRKIKLLFRSWRKFISRVLKLIGHHSFVVHMNENSLTHVLI